MLFFSTCCVCLWGCHEGFGVRDVELTMEKLVNARHVSYASKSYRNETRLTRMQGCSYLRMRLSRLSHLRQTKHWLCFAPYHNTQIDSPLPLLHHDTFIDLRFHLYGGNSVHVSASLGDLDRHGEMCAAQRAQMCSDLFDGLGLHY